MTAKRASRRRGLGLFGLLSLLSGVLLAVFGLTIPAGATDVTPVDVPGNPRCADLGFPFGFKLDMQPVAGTYPVSEAESGVAGGGTVTISNVEVVDGVIYFDWSSTIAWDAVSVKQSTGAAVYHYDPEATADMALHPSLTNGLPTGSISHVDWCRDNVVTTTTESTTTTTEATTTTEVTTTTEGTTTTASTALTAPTVLGAVVEQAPAAATLPVTGGPDVELVLLGLGLVLLGAGALRFSHGTVTR